MDIINNRTSSELFHENAYTNNTFSLPKVENTIRNTMENSFKYLMRMQKSFVDIARFNLNETDIYLNDELEPCISLDKEFISSTCRKAYRHSEFYNEYVDLMTISQNPDIFSYTPVVMIDDQSVFTYKVKSSLDGHTEIAFTHIRHLHEFEKDFHKISVTFFKNVDTHIFTTNRNVVEKYKYVLPTSVHGHDAPWDSTLFYFMRADGEKVGSNFFIGKTTADGGFDLGADNDSVYKYLFDHQGKNIEIIILSMDTFEVIDYCPIANRVDNNRQSSVVCLERNEWEHFEMPIPTQNVLIFKHNKVTDELIYENNKEVVLHYPNIYEIMSDDVDKDLYDYKIFYQYRMLDDYRHYDNQLHYVYRYFALKLGTNHNDTIRTLLYTDVKNEAMQRYFFSIFDFEDADYIYDHGDFIESKYPYDFDYKMEKLREFTVKNPHSLMDYGKDVSVAYTAYYLDVKNIDLKERLRLNTNNEAENKSDMYDFAEPHYVFKFHNDTFRDLNLRFFIDGLFCHDTFKISGRTTEYIYIPCRRISEDSRIDIERFYEYRWKKNVTFTDTVTPVEFTFDPNENIDPTLFDMFVTELNGDKIDRSKFKIYALVNFSEYNVSDDFDITEDSVSLIIGDEDYIIDEDGNVFITINDLVLFDGPDDPVGEIILGEDDIVEPSYSDGRMPLRYMKLTKLKVFADDPSVLNRELCFVINKVPFVLHTKITTNRLPKIKLFDGKFPWKGDHSFIRTYINGYYQNIGFDIIEDDPLKTYLVPRCFLNPGDIFTVDISPFSYEKEYHLEEIPEDYLIKVDAALTKPFDLRYYDVYLNGKRLNERNIQMITPDTFQIFNVKSRKNLFIYRRDRDVEFYGFQSPSHVPLDDFLGDENIPTEDKKLIINEILATKVDEEYIVDGIDTETDIREYLEEVPLNIFEKYRFFLDILLDYTILRPNSVFFDSAVVEEHYNTVYDEFSNKKDRLVIRPNVGARNAKFVIGIGKAHLDVVNYEKDHKKVQEMMEMYANAELLKSLPTGTVLGALKTLYEQMNGIIFDVNEDDNSLRVIIPDDYLNRQTAKRINAMLDIYSNNTELLSSIPTGTVLGSLKTIATQMNGITFDISKEDGSLSAIISDTHQVK